MSAAAQEKIDAVQAGAESWSAEEVVRWGLEEFHPRAAIASSFGAEDVALLTSRRAYARTSVCSRWTPIFFSPKRMS